MCAEDTLKVCYFCGLCSFCKYFLNHEICENWKSVNKDGSMYVYVYPQVELEVSLPMYRIRRVNVPNYIVRASQLPQSRAEITNRT